MILPVGDGIGATQVAKQTMSPRRAAGKPVISTLVEPLHTMPGPPGTQLGIRHGTVWLVTTAAGSELISTVGTTAGMIINGIGGCGIGVGVGAGG